ncbi:hypothetical protein DH2020_037244 [Rehmannia glutinosa]|uniref:R2R3-MYB protein n=1 Tax=Rehmannia glutinosa TaxID=99300 RepID=A0ABR0V410_REHGL
MASWGVSEQRWRKGPWTPGEDKLLIQYEWEELQAEVGELLEAWPKKGHITPQEEGIIIELHALWGNKWSTIARYLPGRTDNEIKNYWRTRFKKKIIKPSDNIINQQQHKRKHIETGKDNMKSTIKAASPDKPEDATIDGEKDHKQETTSDTPKIENHQLLMPMICDQDWSDFIPIDNNSYLWGGLWNYVDDQNGNCNKMAMQNQGNVGNNCCLGGDGNEGRGGGLVDLIDPVFPDIPADATLKHGTKMIDLGKTGGIDRRCRGERHWREEGVERVERRHPYLVEGRGPETQGGVVELVGSLRGGRLGS